MIKKNKLIKKLKNLKKERGDKRIRVMGNQFHKLHDSLVNYTGLQFENAEIEMLEKGLKHSPYLNSKREENLVKFAAEVELTIKNFLNNYVETEDLIKPLIRKEHHSTKVNTCLTKEGALNDSHQIHSEETERRETDNNQSR
ncbi:hypothetical protein HHI36_023395 [Cryptolaemus montrouzieri]|uniref:Uncharacterized protein n=1 Tax=Cryptolaemus montrouzieri TaxID=559131 RepID=A0ABD2PG96_9CUCU